MERYFLSKKWLYYFSSIVILLDSVSLFLVPCNGQEIDFTGDQVQGGREGLSTDSAQDERKGKQLFFPVVLWSPPLGFLLASSYSANNAYYYDNGNYNSYGLHPNLKHFLPLYYQPSKLSSLAHTSSPPLTPARVPPISPLATGVNANDEKINLQHQSASQLQSDKKDDQNRLSHASENNLEEKEVGEGATCFTRNNKVGACKPFSQCFPMMEMEYGSENYMDTPLAQQLSLNTNVSTCLKGRTRARALGRPEDARVCCPTKLFPTGYNSEDNGITDFNNDLDVRMPAITQRPPLRFVMSRHLVESNQCGQSKLLRPPQGNRIAKALAHKGDLKITGGSEAKAPEEFPWMAGIFGKNRKLFCGASLITDRFLLGAGHCFATFAGSDIPHLYVHLGDYNIRTTGDGPHEVRRISKLIIHKKFNLDNYHNDIALIKLDRPVNFTSRISPICLPEATMMSLENQKVIVTGWGRKYRYGSLSDVLRKVEMPIWNHDDCKRLYSTWAPGRVQDSNLCAGDGKRNKDACIGDSGGPLTFFDGKKWVQLGITSWGKGCGSFPGVYTKVSKYLMWITKNLQQYG